MDASLLIARLVGPFFLVASLAMLVNRTVYQDLAEEFIESPALIWLTGMFALLAGLAIVNFHNLWVADWRVIITVLGWLWIAKGLARLTMPGLLQRWGENWTGRPAVLVASGVVAALVGLVLCVKGYGLA
jgi:hypothetical protein